MSDSIEAIGAFQNQQQTQRVEGIKPETKKKLEALGIDPKQIKTESEAQKKIKEAEAAQANMSINAGQNTNAMQKVFTETKNLAEKIGINPNQFDDVNKLYEAMDKRIKTAEAQTRDNPQERGIVAGVRQEYDQIYSTYLSLQNQQSKITNNLDMLATYNKIRS